MRVVLASLLVFPACVGMGRAAAAEEPCRADGEVVVWRFPRRARPGDTVRLVVVSETGPPGDLVVRDGDGNSRPPGLVTRHDGPPWSVVATLPQTRSGMTRLEVRRDGAMVACRVLWEDAEQDAQEPRGWDRAHEALYAAWIEHLFAAPPGEQLAFASLDPVLRDRDRNFLHNARGLGEDDEGRRAPLVPDCADLPYVLRAYFAWKLGLPIAYRQCSRGSAMAPPRCGAPTVVEAPRDARGFDALARRIADAVHSGNARTALDDEATDFYPVPLDRAALRPGTVFADPYGHTLVLVQWVPPSAEHGGMLLAVDAQPDNTVSRKRFWEGTFLFAATPSAGPGFKAMRPLLRAADGSVRQASNTDLRLGAGAARFDLQQAEMLPDAFYARVTALIHPEGLSPEAAYEAMLDALVEQLEARVRSVENGEAWIRAHPGAVVSMPTGAAIFETTGPWEDYATPSRDFRLLIAMRVLLDLPERIDRHPQLFRLEGRSPREARAAIERLHALRTAERSITYRRSDGSPWVLSVAELLARRERLEVAYHPNDCVEARWGATEGSPEYATCQRRAPAGDRRRMEAQRAWFREGRRPSR